MKKIISTIATLALAGTLCVGAFAGVKTVSTTEFGTFSYYINASGNGIGASTTISKPSSSTYLRTYEEMQNNATGALIDSDEDSGYGISKAYTLLWKPDGVKVAGFATHEARGKTSIARYTSVTL